MNEETKSVADIVAEFEAAFEEDASQFEDNVDTPDEDVATATDGDEKPLVEEDENTEDDVVDDDEQPEVNEEESQEEQGEHLSDDLHKRNNAFKEMRLKQEALEKELEEARKAAQVIKDIANQSNISTDELIAQYEQDKLNKEAEKQGIDPEFYSRLKETERQLEELRNQSEMDKLEVKLQGLKASRSLSDDEMVKFFEDASEAGLDLRSTDPEVAYKAVYSEKLIADALAKAEQDRLKEKEKRMKSTDVVPGSTTPNTNTSDVDVDEITAILRANGHIQ